MKLLIGLFLFLCSQAGYAGQHCALILGSRAHRMTAPHLGDVIRLGRLIRGEASDASKLQVVAGELSKRNIRFSQIDESLQFDPDPLTGIGRYAARLARILVNGTPGRIVYSPTVRAHYDVISNTIFVSLEGLGNISGPVGGASPQLVHEKSHADQFADIFSGAARPSTSGHIDNPIGFDILGEVYQHGFWTQEFLAYHREIARHASGLRHELNFLQGRDSLYSRGKIAELSWHQRAELVRARIRWLVEEHLNLSGAGALSALYGLSSVFSINVDHLLNRARTIRPTSLDDHCCRLERKQIGSPEVGRSQWVLTLGQSGGQSDMANSSIFQLRVLELQDSKAVIEGALTSGDQQLSMYFAESVQELEDILVRRSPNRDFANRMFTMFQQAALGLQNDARAHMNWSSRIDEAAERVLSKLESEITTETAPELAQEILNLRAATLPLPARE